MILSDDKKRLLENLFSLSALQGVNMILPLITLPYLVRVLGVEIFGLISFTLSIIMYFNILVSFGFELSATKEISLHRDDTKKVAEIFSSVMIVKIVLLCISLLLLSILIYYIDEMRKYSSLYYLTFGIVIGNTIFPSWLFQGIEKMKYITYINVSSKIFFTILIFILVKDSSDFIYVPLLNSLGSILSGLFSLWLVFKVFNYQFIIPTVDDIIKQFSNSYHFFLSRVANNGSRYYATTIIGIYFGNTIVGYYSMIEKLFYAFLSIGGIISQTIYPYMSRTKNIIFLKKVIVIVSISSILILVPLMLYNELFINLIFNENNELLSNIFLIMFGGSIFGIISSLIGYPLLAAFNYVKYANNSLIYGSIVYIGLVTISAIYYNSIYMIVSSVIVYKLIVLLLRVYYARKTNLLFTHV